MDCRFRPWRRQVGALRVGHSLDQEHAPAMPRDDHGEYFQAAAYEDLGGGSILGATPVNRHWFTLTGESMYFYGQKDSWLVSSAACKEGRGDVHLAPVLIAQILTSMPNTI